MLVPSALAIAAALWTAWLVALAAEKRLLDRAIARWRSLPWLGKCAVALVLAGSIAFAGTKPPSGDGPAITNEVCGVDGDATNLVGGVMTLGLSGGATVLGVGATGGEDDGTEPEVPANAPISHLSRITHSMCAAGFVLRSVGTDETFDFSAPPGAFVATNWVRHGAATARVPVGLPDWTFPFGDGYVTNLAVFANGVVMPDVADTNRCFSPFSALLGVVPEANWDGLDADSRPSVFWRTMTDGNSVVCTWQNVLFGRMPDRPVSFQVEFLPHGSFVYRYDLSRLPSEACLSNVTVGVRNGAGAWFAPSVGRSLTSLRFARVTPDDLVNPDRDGDGIPTEVEIFDLGTDPDLPDSDFDGIPDGDEVAAGLDPLTSDVTDAERLERVRACSTNVSETVSVVTNALVAQGLFGAFAATVPAGADAVLWERTFPIGKSNPWQQYFVSAAPDRAEGWMLEGLRLEWEDSAGGSGGVVRSPSGDSWRIPVSEGSVASVTLRLRATAARVRSAAPLHLLAYVQQVRIGGGREVACGGVTYSVFTDGAGSAVGVTVDRSDRPHRGPLSAEESDMGLLGGLAAVGVMYEGDGSGGALRVSRPGAYALPEVPVPTMSPALRRVSRAGGGRVLLVLDPSVWYGEDHCSPVWGCDYDWDDDWYSVDRSYPLDSRCLRRGWHHGRDGEWECNCEPGVSTGLGDGGPSYLSSEFSVDGDRCSGYVRVGDETVWSGSAVHAREGDCGVVGEFTGEEPFDGGCDSCSEGCGDGNCDALETPTLGSLRFRMPLGTPRKGQVSGFVYLDTSVPMAVTPSAFRLLARDDADVTESGSFGTRRIVCADERGRDISIEGITDGVRVTILTTSSQDLEHRWEITNVDGDGSRIRLRKISSQSNVMEDWTFAYAYGDWTRFDNVSQVREELVREDDLNGGSRTLRESRTRYDASGNYLGSAKSCMSLVGSCDNAVVRETWRSEDSGLNCRWQSAEYWDDPQSGRHGKVRLLTSNHRAWEYSDYDSFGRVTIRIRQRGTSRVPASFPAAISNELSDCSKLADAFVTVYGYEAHEGDNGTSEDFRSPRTVSEFVVTDGVATLVSRRWYRYTRNPHGGIASVRRETWRAVSQASAWGDDGLPYSCETTLDANAPGVPLVARGDTVESLDENGILAETEVSVVEGRVVETTRRIRNGVPFDTYRVVEKDDAHGNVLRRAELMADDDTIVSDERSIFDSQNRLRATAFLDGTSLTNHYSCCRLLWTRDRENRRTLRSARTGEDHLYWATEDVWLQEVSTNGLYRVTQHFFDALGRETNTVVYAGMTPGEANDRTASNGKALSSVTTEYPNGGSDLAIRTDERGKVTERRTDLFDGCVETGETILTNGIVVTRTKTRTYFGGGSSTRREWGGGRFAEERRFEEYAADGRRVEYVVTESHDCGIVTNSVTVYDLLGRVASVDMPLGVTSNVYDGASSRLLASVYTAGPVCRVTGYLYSDLGEQVGTVQDGVTNRADVVYELFSNNWWRVTREATVGPSTNALAVTRERLTGLSDDVRSQIVVETSAGDREETIVSYDPGTGIETKTVESSLTGMRTLGMRYGIELSSSDSSGTTSSLYDAFGRQIRVEKGAVVREYAYDVAGSLVETRTPTATNVLVEAYCYDMLGRRVETVDALGQSTYTAYDPLGNVTAEWGATYPVRHEYDTAGRRILLATTRDGVTWDETRWTYDAFTGLCTSKTCADGSTVLYTHTPDGLSLRTTYAGGRWVENVYDDRRRLVGTVSNDGANDSALRRDVFGRIVAESNAVALAVCSRADVGMTATNEAAVVGGIARTLRRTVDGQGRLASFGMDGGYAAQTVSYREDGRIGSISNADVAVDYAYSDDGYDIGYTLSVAGGATFTRTLTRDPYRRELVLNITNSAGGNFAYAYDAISRPVTRNADEFGYNSRSEVVFSRGGAESAEAYAYDEIGNLRYSTFNFVTNTYTANNLNQYTSILRVSASLRETNPSYDADGNLLSFGPWVYAYDSASRLVSVSSNGVLLVTNYYDSRSRRVREVTSDATTTFFYDDWNLVEEHIAYTNGTTSTIHYYWGKDLSGTFQGAGGVGGLLYLTINGTIYIPCYDNNGNVTRYLDSNGSTVATYIYDAFGRTISQSGPLADVFRHRFSSKYFNMETRLYYYGYRFYSLELRRWLNRDPIAENGGLNLYCLCNNNALCSIDTLGRDRYMTTFSLDPRKDQWHVGVAVDTWKCSGGRWLKTGVATFDFGLDDSSFWNRLGTYFVTVGAIMESEGNTLVEPITIPSTPQQDIEMLKQIRSELSNPPLYSFFFNNCIHWANKVIDYGMDK